MVFDVVIGGPDDVAMTGKWLELTAPGTRLWVADLLTASRLVVALVFLVGRPAPATAVLLVVWAWVSDALDGATARSVGGQGRLGTADHVVDAAVGVGLIWYLGEIGFLAALPTRVGAVVLLVLWAVTRVLAVQMLLQTLSYGAFLWWAAGVPASVRWLLPGTALLLLVLEWRRFKTQFVPGFLHGWRDLAMDWWRRVA
jgi:phosphatidylglycerophosphate synthase